MMRAIFDPALQSNLDELISLVLELRDKSKGIDYIYTILYYLSDATGRLARDELQTVLTRHSKQGDELMTTIAQEFRNEGIEIGKQQALRSVARELIKLHDVITVSEITGLAVAEVQEIVNTSP